MKQIYEADYGYRDVAVRVESSYGKIYGERASLCCHREPVEGSLILPFLADAHEVQRFFDPAALRSE
jgi:hypothetical protein